MTQRMIAAIASPHVDILGHCTGRMVLGKGRPESSSTHELVFAACRALRQGGRDQLPARAARPADAAADAGGRRRAARSSIDTDAHAVGQLEWQPYGCARAADAGVPMERIVNTWKADELLAWTASHQTA